jgi:hypothetical protein
MLQYIKQMPTSDHDESFHNTRPYFLKEEEVSEARRTVPMRAGKAAATSSMLY